MTSFVRKRTLTFDVLVLFILQKSNSSALVCLDLFFGGFLAPTKAAFTTARSFLCYKVFKRLNLLVCGIFYREAPIRKWKGLRVLSVDGSTLRLPDHASLAGRFSRHFFGAKANVGRWMCRISYLYDVFNGTVIDARMESFSTSEAHLCRLHLPFMGKGDIVVFDRYYASHELMASLTVKGVHFLFRMREGSWNCVRDFLRSGEMERTVVLGLPAKCRYLLAAYPHLREGVTVRLVRRKDRKGRLRVFATSLLDTERYTRRSLTALYKERWCIEEAYKLIKARLEVADFSGRTLWAVQQDFHAKTMLLSLSAVLSFRTGLPKKKRPPRKKKGTAPRVPMINRTYCLHRTKILLAQLYRGELPIAERLMEFLSTIAGKVEYSKKGQHFKRKEKKGMLSKYNMSYKVI